MGYNDFVFSAVVSQTYIMRHKCLETDAREELYGEDTI